MVEIAPGISVDPSIRFGRPVISGTRVPVETIVGRIASGLNITEVAEEYGISENDVQNALKYAAKRIAEEQVWVRP